MNRLLMLMLVVTMASGCAIGRKQDYRTAAPSLPAKSIKTVAVAVQDRRPDVVTHEVEESYVGMQRGGYGNPFDVRTVSGQPLASDMAKVIAEAFGKSGIKAVTTPLPPELGRDAVIARLTAGHPDRCLLVTLREWQTDTYAGTEIQYDLDMEAFSSTGALLALQTSKGIDQLGRGFWDPQSVAQEKAPPFFKKKMEDLYSGDIEKAINQGDAGANQPKPGAPASPMAIGN